MAVVHDIAGQLEGTVEVAIGAIAHVAALVDDELERHEAQDRAARVVALADRERASELELPGTTELDDADDALTRMATREDVDLVVVATGGVVSLRPVLAALAAGKVVATANKETLVAGGHLVMPLAEARAAEVAARDASDPMASRLAWVRPIDSEHSALWQCLVGEELESVFEHVRRQRPSLR